MPENSERLDCDFLLDYNSWEKAEQMVKWSKIIFEEKVAKFSWANWNPVTLKVADYLPKLNKRKWAFKATKEDREITKDY